MNEIYSNEKIKLPGILAEFREALEDEIDKIKKNGQLSILLQSGQKIKFQDLKNCYRFKIEYVPNIPADTPCKLLIGNTQYDVTVIGFDENFITLSSNMPLPDTIASARLENGSTVLMERLIKCIEQNAEKKNKIGEHMFLSENDIYPYRRIFTYGDLLLGNTGRNKEQKNATVSALSNDITYIWGPPGTGKTTVIGDIIDELYRHNRSVLLVSHTNTAVDGAIKKAYDTICDPHSANAAARPILRIGTPTDESFPKSTLLEAHVNALGQELLKQKTSLEQSRNDIQNRINEIILSLEKAKWIDENKLEQIKEIHQQKEKYLKSIKTNNDEIKKLEVMIQQKKADFPEYATYQTLLETINTVKVDYYALCEEIDKSETAIKELPLQIQYANDEIRKHDVYAELRTKEAKFMPLTFIQNELAKSDTQIELLEAEISELNSARFDAEQALESYQQKGSFAKLFSGKRIAQSQETLQKINLRLPKAKDELTRQCNLRNEYSRQVDTLLLLQDQIKAVIPTKTQEYWKDRLEQLNYILALNKIDLPKLKDRQSSLCKESDDLKQQLEQAKTAFDMVNEYEILLTKKLKEDTKLNEVCCQEIKRFTKYIDNECKKCADFRYFPTAKDDESIFEELSELLSFVKHELSHTNTEILKAERESAEEQLKYISRKLNEIKQKMQELEREAIMNAKIVGTTLAKSYLSETLRDRTFDTVIVDEASMASIPALWCAAYLADNSLVIVGDFLQLPPIVMAETPMAKKWLGKDIFYHSGMQEAAKDKKTCPENFVMLNEQFRMESDIADIANMYYGEYGGLRSDDTKEGRVKDRNDFYKWYCGDKTNSNIHLIDTESLHAWVTGVPQGKGHSRLNCFSAAVAVELAFSFLGSELNKFDAKNKPSILIVAPYKPHVTLLNQLIDLRYRDLGFKEKEKPNYIRAGTIHSFQGSEADIVIFDLVVDEPHWKTNLFMTTNEVNEDLRKMFNVAVTRAKFKLYVVGNFAFCQRRAKNNALSELLDKLLNEKQIEKTDAKKLLPDIMFSRPTDFCSDEKLSSDYILCREDTFDDKFMQEIRSFKKRLIIYSPFITEARLGKLLPAFADAINSGKQIIVVTKALSDRKTTELSHYQTCKRGLQNIGVKVLHKKGMHEKLIFVDSDAIWQGSLNALSFTGQTGETMFRIKDPTLIAEFEKCFDIEHICDAVENPHELKCPICNGDMEIKESDQGGIFWQCINKDYSRNTAQQYPSDGILRCKCGAPYVFSMKKEPRWICSKDPKHYQKIRENDLKLEKMAALIPTKAEQTEVARYFAQKRKEDRETKISNTPKQKNASKSPKTKKSSSDINTPEQLTLF